VVYSKLFIDKVLEKRDTSFGSSKT